MAYTKRVTINREAVNLIRLVLADGLNRVGLLTLAATSPPDLPPIGEGLVQAGGVITFIDGRKVADTTSVPDNATSPQQDRKPSAARLPRPGILTIVGYGFPAHLVHNGSIHNRAKPFLARSRDLTTPRAGGIMRDFVRPRLSAIGHQR